MRHTDMDDRVALRGADTRKQTMRRSGRALMVSTVATIAIGLAPSVPSISYAASYRLYQSVSQAWAARGFVARPSSPTYRAPGSTDDPWGPYIKESARRFAIPETWIRAVMHQESGGKQYLNGDLTTSGAGAMGLMQLMPATYADMQSQYGLGSDPYDPHDNIQAGTAYIRLMYDRYGAPGFLAAYNAGPDRVDAYLNNGRPLPDETVNYVAAITPNLGGGVAVRGKWAPVAVAMTGATSTEPDAYYARADLTRTADGCLRDPNAAYDPSGPCLMDRDIPHPDPVPDTSSSAPMALAQADTSVSDAAVQPVRAVITTPVENTAAYAPDGHYAAKSASNWQNNAKNASIQPAAVVVPFGGRQGGEPIRTAHTLSLPSARPVFLGKAGQRAGGRVQVGAFASYAEAQRVAEKSTRVLASRSLQATPAITSVSVSGKSFYRAQLVAENGTQASGVCQILHAQSVPCIPVKNG
ncbi:lytic transglycosylase domain-containing protein [Acetobacter indonesiensis]|nr:lytic transglycosylase domain-containing protein [Acetobacter indonesiensis]MCP1231057.1 lytic transglycosylase domain-containing protein [Acetobacter indonesiensis]